MICFLLIILINLFSFLFRRAPSGQAQFPPEVGCSKGSAFAPVIFAVQKSPGPARRNIRKHAPQEHSCLATRFLAQEPKQKLRRKNKKYLFFAQEKPKRRHIGAEFKKQCLHNAPDPALSLFAYLS